MDIQPESKEALTIPAGNHGKDSSTWGPMKIRIFKALLIASLASNIGTWMHDVAAAWLMTSLAPTPLMVSLVQAAATFPLFLFILPAGAIADTINKKHLLILTHFWMILAALSLSLLTWWNLTTGPTLLICIFALSIGMAFTNPAWGAIIPDIVPREMIPSAIALNSVGFNLARAIGPAIGGLIVASLGPAFVFLLNSLSYIGVAIVLYTWKFENPESTLPPESMFRAIRVGWRHVINSQPMMAVLIKGGSFILGASAMWAVLPLYVRKDLGLNSFHYGILIGSLGLGAVLGGTLLSRLREKFSIDKTVVWLLLVFSAVIFLLAVFTNFYLLCMLMFIGGIGWIILLSTYNIASQFALPAWVRARGLSIYSMVFFGGLAIGSAVWGVVANFIGIPYTLMAASGIMLLGLLFTRKFDISYTEKINLSVSKHWPTPQVHAEPDPEGGPIVVRIEYQIDPGTKDGFLTAMKDLFISRKRTGAFRWRLTNDLSSPDLYIESFVLPSWIEHMRQYERITEHEKEIEEKVKAFHVGKNPPEIRRFLSNRVK
jgi:MFS family permease